VGIASKSTGSGKSSSRGSSVMTFISVVLCLGCLGIAIIEHSILRSAIYLTLVPIALVQWYLCTKRSFADINSRKIWILPIPILLVITTTGLFMRWFIVSGIALAAALIAQLLIVLIPPPKDLELNKNEVSDGQNP
jgi:hypothetical protein